MGVIVHPMGSLVGKGETQEDIGFETRQRHNKVKLLTYLL